MSTVTLPTEQFVQIANYLKKRPFEEVYVMMAWMMSISPDEDDKDLPEPPKNPADEQRPAAG